jgi:hypothetical protein
MTDEKNRCTTTKEFIKRYLVVYKTGGTSSTTTSGSTGQSATFTTKIELIFPNLMEKITQKVQSG